MSYRKRDSGSQRAAYSSADAYRSLPTAAAAAVRVQDSLPHSSSSEEDHLTSPPLSPATNPQSFLRTRTRARRDSESERPPLPPAASPLAPPRPLFHGDRSSWSSGASSSVPDGGEPGSDSDNSAGPGMAGVGSRPQVRPQAAVTSSTRGSARARNQGRRRSSMANEYTPAGSAEDGDEPISPASDSNPFGDNGRVAPPSAYSFPFQSHPGNPDPGTHVPGMGRRSSLESVGMRSPGSAQALMTSPTMMSPPTSSAGTTYPAGYGLVRAGSDVEELGRPYAPFMEGTEPALPRTSSQSQLYRDSAAGAMSGSLSDNGHGLAHKASNPNFQMRAAFLSPNSRPGSSMTWAPPAFPYPYPPSAGSLPAFPGSASTGRLTPTYGIDYKEHLRKARPPMASNLLAEKLPKEEKPWLLEKDKNARLSWWLTIFFMFFGIAGAAVYIYFGWQSVLLLPDSDLCLALDEEFNSLDLNSTWNADVELGGFGNGEFQMTTTNSNNLYVNNGELYIVPTLTSAEIGEGSVLDGYTYTLSGCTTSNSSACSVKSDNSTGTVVNPVQSARISTQQTYSIKYGRVEVRAKLPRGDWLWPAIWMLPVNNTYGAWPLSGEIDLMEARGNSAAYPGQGVNYVRASLNYGPLASLVTQIYGWWSMKQSTYADDFHVYALEWTPEFMRLFVDTRIHDMLQLKITGKGGKSFWTRGGYPATAQNNSATEVVVEDVWQNGAASAPFDQNFYLILDLAVGATNGWFPDGVGNKPWYDSSATAMRDFALAQDTWSATWPSDPDDGGFRVDYVKMWNYGACS